MPALPSGLPPRTQARGTLQITPNREFTGKYARTFQSTSIASGCDTRKTRFQPAAIGLAARKIRTSALFVTFRRAHFGIHAFVDGGARPLLGFATSFEPTARTQIRISTSG
jgi:hypothetical protein